MLPEPLSPAVTLPPGDEYIVHILFMDIVGYSLLPPPLKLGYMNQLQDTVRGTLEYTAASQRQSLIAKPKGDGMALIFSGDPLAPLRCAAEIALSLRQQAAADWEKRSQRPDAPPALQLRMGIHSGPVMRARDINGDPEVQGDAIVTAQRVMNCGDANHILVSAALAELLANIRPWSNYLRDIQMCTIKHGHIVHLYNFYGPGFGYPPLPKCLATPRINKALESRPAVNTRANTPVYTGRRGKMLPTLALLTCITGLFLLPQSRERCLALAAYAVSHIKELMPRPASPAHVLKPEKSLATSFPAKKAGKHIAGGKQVAHLPSHAHHTASRPSAVSTATGEQAGRLGDEDNLNAAPEASAPTLLPPIDNTSTALHHFEMKVVIPIDGHVTVKFHDVEPHEYYDGDDYLAGQVLPMNFDYRGPKITLTIKYGGTKDQRSMVWEEEFDPQQTKSIHLKSSND